MTSISGYSSALGMSSLYSSLTTRQQFKSPSASGSASDAVSQFLAYQKMTPEQKLRDSVLKKLGLTEEQVKAMDPKTQKEVETKIKEEMAALIKGKMAERGLLVDLQA